MLLLLLLLLALPTAAEESAMPPGWTLTRIQSETEDGTYDQREFFALKPADERPAVTVDSSTARGIRTGKINPDTVYASKNGGGGAGASAAAPQAEEKEYVYGASNGGIVQAEPVLSTAPIDQRPPELPPREERPVAPPRPNFASSSGSFGSSPSQPAPYRAPPRAEPLKTSGASSAPIDSRAPASASAPSSPPAAPSVASAEEPASAAEKSSEKNKTGKEEKPKVVNGGIAVNNVATGFGTKIATEKEISSSNGGMQIQAYAPCVRGKKVLTTPADVRIGIPRACTGLSVTLWGAGGGAGAGGPGGAGAYISITAPLDGKKYDVVAVNGEAGGSASAGAGGKGGLPGGGAGGASSAAAGGGGGGYSGVFVVAKGEAGTPQRQELALAVAAGGGGGSGRGGAGGGGGWEKGEGGTRGASQNEPGSPGAGNRSGRAMFGGEGDRAPNSCAAPTQNAQEFSCTIYDAEGNPTQAAYDYDSAAGGGGGGGYFGGGGGAAASGGANSEPGGGGASFARGNGNASPGQGTTPGMYNHPDRGNAGSPGNHGRVVVEWY